MINLLISLPKELYEELRKRSYEEHKSMSQLVREALLSVDLLIVREKTIKEPEPKPESKLKPEEPLTMPDTWNVKYNKKQKHS